MIRTSVRPTSRSLIAIGSVIKGALPSEGLGTVRFAEPPLLALRWENRQSPHGVRCCTPLKSEVPRKPATPALPAHIARMARPVRITSRQMAWVGVDDPRDVGWSG